MSDNDADVAVACTRGVGVVALVALLNILDAGALWWRIWQVVFRVGDRTVVALDRRVHRESAVAHRALRQYDSLAGVAFSFEAEPVMRRAVARRRIVSALAQHCRLDKDVVSIRVRVVCRLATAYVAIAAVLRVVNDVVPVEFVFFVGVFAEHEVIVVVVAVVIKAVVSVFVGANTRFCRAPTRTRIRVRIAVAAVALLTQWRNRVLVLALLTSRNRLRARTRNVFCECWTLDNAFLILVAKR